MVQCLRHLVLSSSGDPHSAELRHNIGSCAPCRTTSPPVLLIASPIRRKASTPPALASGAHSAVGRRASTTTGFVPVATRGTRSTRVGCARHAFTNGLLRSVSSVAAGRRIPTGMRSETCGANDRGSFEPNAPCDNGPFLSLGASGTVAVPACAKVTILKGGFKVRVGFCRRAFEVPNRRRQCRSMIR